MQMYISPFLYIYIIFGKIESFYLWIYHSADKHRSIYIYIFDII